MRRHTERSCSYLRFTAEGRGAGEAADLPKVPRATRGGAGAQPSSGLSAAARCSQQPHPGKALLSSWSAPSLVPPISSGLRQDAGGDPSPARRARRRTPAPCISATQGDPETTVSAKALPCAASRAVGPEASRGRASLSGSRAAARSGVREGSGTQGSLHQMGRWRLALSCPRAGAARAVAGSRARGGARILESGGAWRGAWSAGSAGLGRGEGPGPAAK